MLKFVIGFVILLALIIFYPELKLLWDRTNSKGKFKRATSNLHNATVEDIASEVDKQTQDIKNRSQ